jgi:large subunit ribosomal protein L21e
MIVMATRIGGLRRKTRHIFQNNIRAKGKLSIRRFLQELQVGERVVLKAQPTYQDGIYYRRFHGKSGIVTGKQGDCYRVEIKDFKAIKTVIVHPAHVKRG